MCFNIISLPAKQRTENSGRCATEEEADEHQEGDSCYETQRTVSRIATKTNVAMDIATNADMYDQSGLSFIPASLSAFMFPG